MQKINLIFIFKKNINFKYLIKKGKKIITNFLFFKKKHLFFFFFLFVFLKY